MKPRIAISRCLLGDAVRYDGESELRPHLLQADVEWVPLCPEVEAGLPVPRERIRLEGPREAPRVVGEESGRDVTDLVTEAVRRRIEALLERPLHGAVLKSRSPSCGIGSTKRWRGETYVRDGVGLFARELLRRVPHLPIVEEQEVATAEALCSFLERCRAVMEGGVGDG